MNPEDNPKPEKTFKIEDHSQDPPVSVSDFVSQTQPIKEKRQKQKRRRIVTAVILLVLVLSAGGYFIFSQKPAEKSTDKTAESTQQPETPIVEDKDVKTENFVSNELGLAFDYPSNWKLNYTSGEKQVSVDSPAVKLKTPDGESKTGKVVMTIRGKTISLSEIKSDNSTAARDSVKLSYKKPSPNQRGQTYLAFLHFPNSLKGGVDGMYIMGDTGYKKDQYIPKADFTPIDPVVSFAFYVCNNGCSDKNTSLSVASSEWEDNPIFSKAKTIIESLIIN